MGACLQAMLRVILQKKSGGCVRKDQTTSGKQARMDAVHMDARFALAIDCVYPQVLPPKGLILRYSGIRQRMES